MSSSPGAKGGAGIVRVGGSTSIGTYCLPSLVAGFTALHPRIEVSLGIENTAHIEERLLRSEFDIGFVGGPLSSGELAAESLLEDEIFFACAPSHPLASPRSRSLKNLADAKLFIREAGSATRGAMEERLREKGLNWGATTRLGSVEAIKQAVMAGLGLSYFSSLTVRSEIESGRLVRIPARGLTVRRPFSLVTCRRKRRTPALEAFIDFAKGWSFAGS